MIPNSANASGTSFGIELPIAPDHPAFAGHFPGNPIVPGVVLLDCALREIAAREALALAPLVIRSAKFHSPAVPGERLFLKYDAAERASERSTTDPDANTTPAGDARAGKNANARFVFSIFADANSADNANSGSARIVASGSFTAAFADAASADPPASATFER